MAVKYFSSYKKELFQCILLEENKFIISKGITLHDAVIILAGLVW